MLGGSQSIQLFHLMYSTHGEENAAQGGTASGAVCFRPSPIENDTHVLGSFSVLWGRGLWEIKSKPSS